MRHCLHRKTLEQSSARHIIYSNHLTMDQIKKIRAKFSKKYISTPLIVYLPFNPIDFMQGFDRRETSEGPYAPPLQVAAYAQL